MVNIAANFVIVAVIAAVLIGSMGGYTLVAANGKGAIYRGNTAEARVTLMINVYTGTEYIKSIMEVFERYGCKTTFFIGGSWAAKNNDLVKKMYESGHEIANHGYFHKDHKNLSYAQNEQEILVTEKLIQSLTGNSVKLFAPPSGSMGGNMFDVCEKNGFKVIMWSRDTIDWRDKDADLVYTRATKDTQNGELILMHPTEHTLRALPKILSYYKSKGIKVVTVGENLSQSF